MLVDAASLLAGMFDFGRPHAAGSRRPWPGLFAAILLLILSVSACGTGTTNSSPTVSASPAPSPTPSWSPAARPSATPPSPTPGPTVTPSPTPFAVVAATSCASQFAPGASPMASFSPAPRNRLVLQIPVLEYHRIVPASEAGNSLVSLVIPPPTFDAQLAALASAGWRTITAATLGDDLAAGVKLPPKTFVITIDDGWEDGYTYALPILRRHDFVATYYVIAVRIGWQQFLNSTELQTLVADGMEIDDHSMDHVSLGGGTDARLTYEIDGGAATIAAVTGRWPRTLAYPSGHTSLRAQQIIAACGMSLAFIEGNGTYESWATRLVTPRVKVYPGTEPITLLSWIEHPWPPAPPTPPSTEPAASSQTPKTTATPGS